MQDAFRGLSWLVPRSVLKLSSLLERRNLIGGPRFPVRKALAAEILAARGALREGDLATAEHHAGRVHILGSYYAISHWYSHRIHLSIEWRRRSLQGILIQLLRLIGTPFTRLAVPFFGVTGHPGTSERAMGTHWPIDNELQTLLDTQLRAEPPFGLRIPPR